MILNIFIVPMPYETKHYNMNLCKVKGFEHLGNAKIVEEKLDKVKVLFSSGKTDWFERKDIKRVWS